MHARCVAAVVALLPYYLIVAALVSVLCVCYAVHLPYGTAAVLGSCATNPYTTTTTNFTTTFIILGSKTVACK